MKKTLGLSLGLLLILMVGTLNVSAANTVFDQPHYSDNIWPQGRIYSNYTNITIDSMPYGIIADLENVNGISAALNEVHTHLAGVGGHKHSIAIYTNGADLSADDVNSLVNNGWPRAELYYERYFVSVNPQAASEPLAPRMWAETDNAALKRLAEMGMDTSAIASFGVSGITQPFFGAILYEPAFSFLSGKTLYLYKFEPRGNCFVPLTEVYYNSYGPGFMDVFGLNEADGSPNGTFVVTTVPIDNSITMGAGEWKAYEASLPAWGEPVVVTADEISSENLKKEMTATGCVRVESPDGLIGWQFREIIEDVDLTTAGTLAVVNEEEVSVDFAHSGNLPGEAEVTIRLPESGHAFHEGESLFLYYCNPVSEQNELVSEGVFSEGSVSFHMTHCSEYIVTNVDHGEAYKETEPETTTEETTEEVTTENPTADATEEEVSDNASANPVTSDAVKPKTGLYMAIGAVVILAAVIGLVLARKKK